jgi:diguanylate cyclase (GGDEF)-like protein
MVDILLWITLGIIVGVVAGWVACHAMTGGSRPPAAEKENDKLQQDQQRVDQIAGKIRTLTASVAADVSDHQTRVAEITSGLQASNPETAVVSIVDMVAELVAANRIMEQRLSDTQSQLRDQTHQLQTTRQLANTDALTGLANRRMLDNQLTTVVNSQPNAVATLALLDIDLFKSVNDNYGHQTGDDVLRRVAELMEVSLNDHGLCARYGGEEFALFASTGDWKKIATAIEDFRVRLGRSRIVSVDNDRSITFSCGLAARQPEESLAAWIERADKALYAAKQTGRNSVFISRGSKAERFSPEAKLPAKANANQNASAPVKDTTRLEDSVSRRKCMVSQMRTMVNNIDLAHVGLAAVAVRLPQHALDAEQRETLLKESRRLMRAVDKVDFDDNSTILSLMVTSDIQRAEERAELLLDQINYTLRSFDETDSSQPLATLGISMYSEDTTADEVICRAVALAHGPGQIG